MYFIFLYNITYFQFQISKLLIDIEFSAQIDILLAN